jgi:tRNA (cytidine/uridine-2'-O-)-methyltransferase
MVRPLGFHLTDRHLRRAGLDYWQYLNWQVVSDWNELVANLPPERMWFFSKFGQCTYTDVSYSPGDVFVFGNESQGLPEWIRRSFAHRLLRIPIRAEVRSLNLSVSVGIAVFEALRQFGPAAPTVKIFDDLLAEKTQPRSSGSCLP